MGAETTDTKSTETPAFDPVKFRQEMADQQIETNKQLTNNILDRVNAVLSGHLEATKAAVTEGRTPPAGSDELNEFAEEMKTLQIDENQAKNLLSMVTKLMKKQAVGFKKEVIDEVETTADKKKSFSDRKAALESEVSTIYPAILDKNSPLFKAAQVAYDELSKEEKALPSSTYLAVTRAATRIGVRPLTIEDLKAQDAKNETGGAGGSGKGEDKISDKTFGFAESFGVTDRKLYEQKLKLIQNRKTRAA